MDKNMDEYIRNRYPFWAGYGILGIIGRGTAYCHIDESYILGDEAQEKTASVCLNVTIDITIKE